MGDAALHLRGGSGLHPLSQGRLGQVSLGLACAHHRLDWSVIPTYLHLFHKARGDLMVAGGSCVGSVIPEVLLLEVVFLVATYEWRPRTLAISDLLDGPLILLMLMLVMLRHILGECLLVPHLPPYRGFPLGRAQACL
jgi:hypothetical protein